MTSLVTRDINCPLVLRAKKLADWPSMWPNSALRTSRTTSCPTSVIRYVEKYAPTPFTSDVMMMKQRDLTDAALGIRTSSKIGLMRYASQAEAAP